MSYTVAVSGKERVDVYIDGTGVPDDNDRPPCPDSGCNQCGGMPVWSVSEPYLSLWINDEPLGYQPAVGPRISLTLGYKQRETQTGLDPAIFGVGKQWNCSWVSYVTNDANGNHVVNLPGGGSLTFTNSADFLTNTRLAGDTTAGFTLSYPDGSQYTYGSILTNTSGAFQKAFMSEQRNLTGQKTRFEYSLNPTNLVVRLKNVVDGDGRTNTITYVTSNSYSTNLISQVTDGFNRSAIFSYDSSGHLASITDVAGLTGSIGYDSNGAVTNLATPYGQTSFKMTDNTLPFRRSIEVTEPTGSKQLYLYTNSVPGVASSYPTNQVPNTAPYSNTFETNSLDVRNTFHWGRLQYANLSTNYLLTGDLNQLQSNDYLSARMKHWLQTPDLIVTEVLSMERDPSPDGVNEGQKTWYDYAGKTNINYVGTQVSPLFAAKVLPDGTTSFERTDRNSIGNALTNVTTYSIGANLYLRTNLYGYATNAIDLITVTNALGVQVSSNAYNSYHQVLTNFNALNEKTAYTYNTNQQLTSVTRPNGLVTTNIYFTGGTFTNWLDRTMDFSGSTYFRTNAFTYANGLVFSQTDERGLTVTNYYDALQRPTGRLFPDGTTTSNLYYRLDGQSYPNSSGGTNLLDLTATKDRLGGWTYFAYDAMRRKLRETNALGTVTAYGYCQCGALENVTKASGITGLEQITSFVYDNQGNRLQTHLPDGSVVVNKYDSLRRVTNVVNGFASLTNTYNNQGLVVAVSNAFGRVQSATFDILDRATNTVDANGVSINSTYDNLDRLLTRAYPDTGQEKFAYTLNIAGITSYTNQLGSNVVNYVYDALGRKTNEVTPGITTNSFTYNAASDLLTLTDGKGQITRWNYDQYGRATNKVDAASTEIFRYQYDPDNRLTNRWSAAKGSTTYKYDQIGNLTNVVHPVSTNIVMRYDALSRLTNMVDAAGTTVYAYTNQFLSSEDGPWDNDTVSYTYANRLRSGLTLLQPNTSSWTQNYGYDTANRLSSLTSPAGSFNYNYSSGLGGTTSSSSLVQKLYLPNGSYITNTFDSVGRVLTTKLLNSSASVLNSHAYGYNLANQRTALTNTAGNYLNFTYDNIGQLKTALGKESGGSSRVHEQFGYAYDAASNLKYRTNNTLVQTFGLNNLNELTNVTRSGTLTVAGATSATATSVTVADNGNSAVGATLYADKMFARTNVALLNGNNTITAVAQDSYGRQDTNSVTVSLPATVTYIYDSNGNLTSDGTRGFDYDDENQLIRVTVTNSWKSEFTYDGNMRRRIRKEFTWQNSTWVQTADMRYIYDGMLVVQERDGNNLPTVMYTRGRDLSGSLQDAGGIGGLLARTDAANGQTAWYEADGNGTVTALVNAQQVLVAKYTYDPFGNILSKSGLLADANAYRFSSQEYHQPSGLSLYLYRAYDPNLQRWLNRDPIAERGGINLYGMVGNNPINVIDPFGEAWYNPWTWFDPNPGDNVELANGDWYGPALTKPDGILTPLSGGRENLFSDFKDDVHHLGSEIGKELAVNGAMMLIPEEEALGIVGKWLKKLKPAKSCEKIPKIPGNPFKGKKAAQDAFNHLEKYHGLDPAVASERLHKLKEMNGLGAADNAVIGKTGDVYNPHTGEWLGSLTDPTLGK